MLPGNALRPATIKGPALFVAQFIGPPPLFDTLPALAAFAAGQGFKALQLPIHDPRIVDAGRLDDGGHGVEIAAILAAAGLTTSEVAAHRAGQLLAVHPAYDDIVDALAPAAVRGDPAARQARAEADLRRAIALAAQLGANKVATFSGGLAWPYWYLYPPLPPGLVDLAFATLARRWRPLLDAADTAGVDLCFELHPGQDVHDGATFARFLDAIDGHPRAKILYDPSHLRLQHMDYLGFIDRWHERIGAFHVKDAEFTPSADRGVYGGYGDWLDRPGRFRSPGDGDIDFKSIFARLTRHGYDGWATLEWECCLKNALDGAAEGARFIVDHIIRIAERPFDAGMRTSPPTQVLERMLGLKR